MTITDTIQKGLNFVKRQRETYKINLLRVSAQNFLTMLTQQYQSIYIVRLGATPIQLGIANSVGGLAETSIAAPTGWLADRHGIRKILLSTTPFLALGALIFALAQNWMMVIPAMFISTLSMRATMTVCPMVCSSCLKNEERATGMQLCDTLTAIPRLISPMIGALIVNGFGGISREGIKPLYYLQAAGFCLIFILTLKKFTNPYLRGDSESSSFIADVRELFKLRTRVKRWILYNSLFMVPWYIGLIYVPLFAAEVKHADQFVLGGMAAASTAAPLLLSIIVGKIADTYGRKKVIYVTTSIYCLSLLLLVYAPNPTTIFASGVLQGFFMLGAVTQGAMTAELVPIPLLGRWFGILGFFSGLVSVLTPILGGAIWSTIGPAYIFLFVIFTQVLQTLLLKTVPETLKKNRDRSDPNETEQESEASKVK